MRVVSQTFEFSWDKGNSGKNLKHQVTDEEAEKMFFDEKKVIYGDVFHSQKEERFVLLGKTEEERLLYVVFTRRGHKVRIVSARGINKKEVRIYEEVA